MSSIKVLGITTTREIYVGSKDRNFRNNEYLIVEDRVLGNVLGEIVEAQTYNRFIPLELGGDFVDASVLSSLRAMGYDLDEETVYIGKLRFFEETLFPVLTGSDVRGVDFDEVKKFLFSAAPEEGFVLGVIKNTDDILSGSPKNYRDLCDIFDGEKYFPQRDLPYVFDYKSMHQYPHIGIFGGSGSGKSFGLRVLLEEIMRKNIPTLVMDPHFEMIFSEASEVSRNNYDDDFCALKIGTDVGIDFKELSKTDLKNLLNSAFALTDSMKNVIDIMFRPGAGYFDFEEKLSLLLRAQEMGGRDQILRQMDFEDNPDVRGALKKMLEIFEEYDKTCNNQSVRAVNWRLKSLNQEGVFRGNCDILIDSLKANKLVVLQGSTRTINVFSTYILNKLYYLRKEFQDAKQRGENLEYFPPFIIVTDEAHNFAPKGFETPSKGVLKEISQEGRKYGVFLILATQRPTLLDETINAQLNTKFIFRTVRASDIDTIREETDLNSDETKRLPYLKTGDVFISSAERGRTSFVRIRASHTNTPHKLNPFDELESTNKRELIEFAKLIKGYFPINTSLASLDIIKELKKNHDIDMTIDQFKLKLKQLVDMDIVEKKTDFLGEAYKLKEEI